MTRWLLTAVLLLAGTSSAWGQMPVTGALRQGAGAQSTSAWPVIPAQAISLNRTATSGADAALTMSLTGAPTQRIAIRGIVCYLSAAGTSTLTVSDGATVILDLGTFTNLAAGAFSFGLATGVWGMSGNNMTVNIGAAGGTVTSTCSVIADRS